MGCIYVKGFAGVPGPVNCVTDVEFGLFEERDNRLDFVCPRTRAGINDTARRDSFLIKFTSDPNHHFSSLVAVMVAAEDESVSLNCSEIQAWRLALQPQRTPTIRYTSICWIHLKLDGYTQPESTASES